MRILNNIILILIIIAIFVNNLHAAENNTLLVCQSSRISLKTDIKDQTGTLNVAEYNINLEKECTAFDRLPITTSFNIHHIQINNTSEISLPSSLETKNIYTRFFIPMPGLADERFYLGIDLSPGYNTVSGHDFDSEAFRFNYGAAIIYRNGAKLIIAAGTMFRPEYETSVVPYIGFKYKANDKLDLNFLSLNPNIAYRLNEKSRILLELNILADEFKITQGDRQSQILRAYGLDAGCSYEHNISQDLIGKISIGGTFAKSFEYRAAGTKSAEIKPENSIYIGYNLKKNF